MTRPDTPEEAARLQAAREHGRAVLRDQMRAAIYTRVSDDSKNGRSVAEQQAECRQVCEREGWLVGGVYTDNDIGASVHSHQRKGGRGNWERLKDDVRAGNYGVVVCWEASRFQRDLEAYTVLRKLCQSAGVLLSYKGRTYDLSRTDDRFKTGIDALIAELSSSETRDRVLRAAAANAVAGKPAGRHLYGYTREYDPRTGDLLKVVIREDQAAVVREVAARFASGESLHAIAADLNKRGIPAPDLPRIRVTCSAGHAFRVSGRYDGAKVQCNECLERGEENWAEARARRDEHDRVIAPWDGTQVRRILLNPGYIGRRVHQGEITGDAIWDPILDVETFWDCQKRLADPKRKTARDFAVKHLLSGNALCGVCGAYLRKVPNHDHRSIYQCRSRGGDPRIGRYCTSIVAGELEQAVTRALIRRLSRGDAREFFVGDRDERAAAAAAKAADLRQQLAGYTASAKAGRISMEFAESVVGGSGGLESQIRALEEEATRTVPVSLKRMCAPDAAQKWEHASLAQKREVLKAALTVTLYPAGRPQGRVEISWRNGGPPQPVPLEVRPARRKYERTCETCGRTFHGTGRYCGDAGCYPSQSRQARDAWYAANRERILAGRRAERAASPARAMVQDTVRQLIADHPQASNREIAELAGTSPAYVWRVRKG